MKKKNTNGIDLKKLAVAGLAAGLLLPAANIMAEGTQLNGMDYSSHLAYGGCGISGGHASNSGGAQGSCSAAAQGNCSAVAQSNCSAQSYSQNWQPQSSCGGSGQSYQAQNWQPQSSCGGSGQSHYQTQNWHPQSSCGGSGQTWHAQSSCGGARQQPQNQWSTNSAPQQNNPYSNPNSNSQNPNDSSQFAAAEMHPMAKPSSDIMDRLSPSERSTFQSLSPEGKALALRIATMRGEAGRQFASERELADKLNPSEKATLQNLSPEAKILVLKLANQARTQADKRNGAMSK